MRKFQQLSYEEVKILSDAITHYAYYYGDKIIVERTIGELKEELEIRG